MTKIEYNGSVVATVEGGNIATLPIKDKKMRSDITITVPVEVPIEVSTEAEMTELLKIGEIGSVYKYTGTTGTYENGALYLLEATDEPDKPDTPDTPDTPDEPEENTFTFTVVGDEKPYTADNGMNWYQWARSSYSNDTSSCESEESRVYIITKTLVLDLNGKAVIGGEPITKGGIYKSINEDDYVEPNTFTINGIEYTMESRAKWYDWVTSDYSLNRFSCENENGYVYEADTKNTVTDEYGNEVLGTQYISEGYNYLIKKHKFSFTIEGDNTYTVEDGTTWRKWVNYDAPDKFLIESGTDYVYISHPTKVYILNSDGNRVKGSNLIIEGTYTIEEPDESNTFTFTIDGTSYTAEEGMRWREWLERDYNTGGFWEDGSDGVFSAEGERVTLDGTKIVATMDIIANASYYYS